MRLNGGESVYPDAFCFACAYRPFAACDSAELYEALQADDALGEPRDTCAMVPGVVHAVVERTLAVDTRVAATSIFLDASHILARDYATHGAHAV